MPPGPGPVLHGRILRPDLTRWSYWWEFHRALYQPRRGRPLDRQRVPGIRGALQAALDVDRDPAVTRAVLVALARIGGVPEGFDLIALIRDRLHLDDRTASVAALALGISGRREAIDELLHLALDTRHGRTLTNRRRVSARVRAAAVYGLGLVVRRCRDGRSCRRAFAGLRAVFLEPSTDDVVAIRNLRVAAIHAMAMFGFEGMREVAIEALRDCELGNRASRDPRVLAHVPPAIAKILGRRVTRVHEDYKRDLLDGLRQRERQDRRDESRILALGMLALPAEQHRRDAGCSEQLIEQFEKSKGAQQRYLALVALGRIGGAANRTFLRETLQRGNKARERPWAALGLGVLESACLAENREVEARATGVLLHKQIRDVKNPESRGAFAVAVGLCGYDEAAPRLAEYAQTYSSRDQLSGRLATGLSLLGQGAGRGAVLALAARTIRRPVAARKVLPAAVRMDERGARAALESHLQAPFNLGGVAEAIGEVRDPHSIASLCARLVDPQTDARVRTEIAAGLGRLAEPEALPWHADLVRDLNYRSLGRLHLDDGKGLFEIF